MRDIITSYIKAGYPGLYLISWEEQRAEAEVAAACKAAGFGLFAWTLTDGVFDPSNGKTMASDPDPMTMLETLAKLPKMSVLLAKDFHMHLTDPNPMLIRKLKDTLAVCKASNRVLIIVGCQLKMQPELEKELTVLEFALPGREDLRKVLEGISKSAGLKVGEDCEIVLDAASGLTTLEAENAFARSVIECGKISPPVVSREKTQAVKKNGVLEIIDTNVGSGDIGGLDQLKLWLGRRRMCFSKEAKAYGLPTPKGVLTVGIPGSGKSLAGKATASMLGVPLLRFDMGRVMGPHVGESERNIRIAIQTAEAIAPCVLWVDELEKSFSGTKSSGSTDGGTTARVFGSFLQWMQDKTAPVFVFATANDISQLPPEFLRKGRFDEIFFVDLPSEEERKEIWCIHIAKKKRDPKKFDVAHLAASTNEFTGAEIEAAFSEAMFLAYDEVEEVSDKHVRSAILATIPLAKTMETDIQALRKWSAGRARPASSQRVPANTGRRLA